MIILSSIDVPSVSDSASESPSRGTFHRAFADFSPTKYLKHASIQIRPFRACNAPIFPKNVVISVLRLLDTPDVSCNSNNGGLDFGYSSGNTKHNRINAISSSLPHGPDNEIVHFLFATLTDSNSTLGNF